MTVLYCQAELDRQAFPNRVWERGRGLIFLFPSVAWEYILGCVASCIDTDRNAVKTAFPSGTWERGKG
jgi:hypothetical protein